jgi:hypothetical protein
MKVRQSVTGGNRDNGGGTKIWTERFTTEK